MVQDKSAKHRLQESELQKRRVCDRGCYVEETRQEWGQVCLAASSGALQTVQVLDTLSGSLAADLVGAKVLQGPGKHRGGRVPRQERGQVRHEPAAEGGAARLQQALQVLLAHRLHMQSPERGDIVGVA